MVFWRKGLLSVKKPAKFHASFMIKFRLSLISSRFTQTDAAFAVVLSLDKYSGHASRPGGGSPADAQP